MDGLDFDREKMVIGEDFDLEGFRRAAGDRIRESAERAGVTLAQLSETSGVPLAELERPTDEYLQALLLIDAAGGDPLQRTN